MTKKPVGMTQRDWDLLVAEREVKRRAEAYPRLIETLRYVLADQDVPASNARVAISQILRSLGETV